MITKRRTKERLFSKTGESRRTRRAMEQARARIALLMLACVLLGAAAGAIWVSQMKDAAAPNAHDETSNPSAGLSQTTKAVLGRLGSPVELRFYSVLDPVTAPESLRAFAGRVDQLLRTYQREANGKVTVTRSNSQAYANANAALADGIKPFNEEKGEPCFLGIAVINQNQKTALSELAPEWEPALEYDITRAILATMSATVTLSAAGPAVTKVDSAALEEVKRVIPNLESLSLADATRLLREASFKEFAIAANQLQTQLKEAQQRLKDAQNAGSETEQQAAMKILQQVQADMTDQLKKIAAKGQAQIEALKQLKSGRP